MDKLKINFALVICYFYQTIINYGTRSTLRKRKKNYWVIIYIKINILIKSEKKNLKLLVQLYNFHQSFHEYRLKTPCKALSYQKLKKLSKELYDDIQKALRLTKRKRKEKLLMVGNGTRTSPCVYNKKFPQIINIYILSMLLIIGYVQELIGLFFF